MQRRCRGDRLGWCSPPSGPGIRFGCTAAGPGTGIIQHRDGPSEHGTPKGGRMNDPAWREEAGLRSTSIRLGDRPVARGSGCSAA